MLFRSQWLTNRGGIAVWQSINLSNPGASWTTPAHNDDGSLYAKPNWQAGNEPRIITDPADIAVSTDRELKRFRVGIRRGTQGYMMKVTDGGSRRIHAEVAKAGEGAYHVFDYSTQEAVIMKPVEVLPIIDYLRREHPNVSLAVLLGPAKADGFIDLRKDL